MSIRTLAGRLTYANVTSTVCLFLALGGSAYAAASITGKNVRNGSLTSADIKDHTLRARDFKLGELPRGPQGPQGERGPAGVRGPAGAAGAAVDTPPPAISRDPVGRLVLPGVTGTGPGGAIQVRTIAWSSVLTGGGGAGTGTTAKPQWGDVTVTKDPDRSSGELWKLAVDQKKLANAKLELLKPGAQAPYATYTFADLRVKGFSTEGSGDTRLDEVRLGFNPIAGPAFAFDAAAPLPALSEPRVGQMSVDGIAGQTDLVLDVWSVVNPGAFAGGGGGAGVAQFGPFVISKGVDATSPALLNRFLTGAHIKTVTVKLLQPGSATVSTTYVLTDVTLGSYAVLGDARPVERIGLVAAKIESTTPVPGGQPIRSCFDLKLQVTC